MGREVKFFAVFAVVGSKTQSRNLGNGSEELCPVGTQISFERTSLQVDVAEPLPPTLRSRYNCTAADLPATSSDKARAAKRAGRVRQPEHERSDVAGGRQSQPDPHRRFAACLPLTWLARGLGVRIGKRQEAPSAG